MRRLSHTGNTNSDTQAVASHTTASDRRSSGTVHAITASLRSACAATPANSASNGRGARPSSCAIACALTGALASSMRNVSALASGRRMGRASGSTARISMIGMDSQQAGPARIRAR